jgi:hypothetical protein
MGPCAEAEVEEGDVGESVIIHIRTIFDMEGGWETAQISHTGISAIGAEMGIPITLAHIHFV